MSTAHARIPLTAPAVRTTAGSILSPLMEGR